MEFKDVLRERLEIEYTKRLFTMIPSKLNYNANHTYRGVNLDT